MQKSSPNDVVFTRRKIAEQLVEKILHNFPDDFKDIQHAIEPSAGNGAFVDVLRRSFPTVIALDIVPRRDDILKQDFFEFEAPKQCTKQSSVCVGNPPFSLASQFLKQCAQVCEKIIMILPRGFYKTIPRTSLPTDWKVEHRELLSSNVFRTNKKIFSCFLYVKKVAGYTRTRTKRKMPSGFSIVNFPNKTFDRSLLDLVFWQSGGNAGTLTTANAINNSRAYGIVFDSEEKRRKIIENEKIKIEPERSTNGRLYITTDAICETLNPILMLSEVNT